MTKLWCTLILLSGPLSFLSGQTVADSSGFAADIRFDIDAGSEFFGYSGALRSEYGMPSVYILGGRVGFGSGCGLSGRASASG
ncbi:MAG: hypothetical protein ABR572_05375 [Cryomorphaceae bacterium]|nr:hypothetical protein [Flavobacteriales bacterium]